MESLQSLEHKYVYDIVGHSGDSACIEFVQAGKPPKNEKERFKVLYEMVAHSQYCWSGDNTINATSLAIRDIAQDDADDHLVFVISDANLKRYGIRPDAFGKILESDPTVKATVLFIGSLGEEASQLCRQLPRGTAYVATDSKKIPQLMREIFSSLVQK